jgi:DNA-binding MarR family transcriptional regulator
MSRESKLDKLRLLMEELREMDQDFTPQAVALILYIGALDHPTQTELAFKTNYSPSGISKTLRKLGDGLNGASGLGLLKFEPAVTNGREKVAWLTPKGEKFLERLLSHF